jgi:hypothetical protein
MNNLTDAQVAKALANLGNYRVKRTQEVANAGLPDGISGSLLLSLGLRETMLQNIEGGAKLDKATGKWVKQDDPTQMDVGPFQISRKYHSTALSMMPGVKNDTWTPTILGMSANVSGYVPRFEDSLQYVLSEMHENMAQLDDFVGSSDTLVQVTVAAHNAGVDGALKGYRLGDIDINTAGGDYSAWVLKHRSLVLKWLKVHPNWYVAA